MTIRNIEKIKDHDLKNYTKIHKVENPSDDFNEVIDVMKGTTHWRKMMYKDGNKLKAKYFSMNERQNILSIETYDVQKEGCFTEKS